MLHWDKLSGKRQKSSKYLHRHHVLLSHLGGPSESEELVIDPLEEIVNSFRSGNDVEGRRNRSAVFKVRYPQLTTGKLPLRISFFLEIFYF